MDDRMLAMDVADTLRHGIDVPTASQAGASDSALVQHLQALYLQQGIEIPEPVLRDGIAAFGEDRFAYRPARGILAHLARLYVSRQKWGPSSLAIVGALVVGVGGYYFAYRPYQAAQAEQTRLELTEALPARMDALYQAIFDDTKVQSAAADAAQLRDQGKTAAKAGNRAGADEAVSALTALRDRLEAAYTLRIVDKDGVKPGFWTFPPNNSEATNYYIVVEAVDANGQVLDLPVTNEDTGTTETVSRWGLRVPEGVYNSVMADKHDDNIVEHSLVGFKQDGFADVDYAVPVLGGAVTKW